MSVVQEGQKWKGCGFCPFFVRVEVMEAMVMTSSVVVRTAINIGKCERERAYSVYVGPCTLLSSPVLSTPPSPALPSSPRLSPARLSCAPHSSPLPSPPLQFCPLLPEFRQWPVWRRCVQLKVGRTSDTLFMYCECVCVCVCN